MSRSVFQCYRCRTPIGFVRSHGDGRTLKAAAGVDVSVRESGPILLSCTCGAVNSFSWRPVRATLADEQRNSGERTAGT